MVVSQVGDASPAAAAGIQRGDVILEVNRKPVTDAAQFESAAPGRRQPAALLLVDRGGDNHLYHGGAAVSGTAGRLLGRIAGPPRPATAPEAIEGGNGQARAGGVWMDSAASARGRAEGGARRSLRFDLKVALFAGFGGVLVLMAFVGVYFIQELRRIQSDDTQITQTYLKRHRLLDQIRSSLYLSSTFLRDYLLQSSPESARVSMAGLNGVRREMELTLREYAASIPPAERQPFAELSAQISRYWKTLEPLSHWTPGRRQAEGVRYLQGQVLPQRTLMLSVAERIDSINEQGLADGTQRVSGLFRGLRRRVLAILGLMLAMGIAAAAVSITQTLGIERESRLRYAQIQKTQGN